MPSDRRRFPLGKLIVAFVVALPVLWYVVQQVGPRVAPPRQDPIAALNQAGEACSPNAATLYQAAFESLEDPAVPDWEDYVRRGDTPLPPELAEWLSGQAPTVDLAREATTMPDCYFTLHRNRQGRVDLQHAAGLRRLAKLTSMRARLASEGRDLSTLSDSLLILNGIARHAMEQPTIVDQLIGIVAHTLALDYAVVPLAWTDTSTAERATYREQVSSLFEPPASLGPAVANERDEFCWMAASALNGGVQCFLPLSRVCGEAHKSFAPLLELARQPVEVRANPANAIRVKIAKQDANPPSALRMMLNVPSMFATQGPAGLERAIDLQLRVIAMQRGNQTVMAVFAHRDAHGVLPPLLNEIDGEFKIDPYTAEPFVYRLSAEGFTLHSAGLDRDDDGGKHHPRWGEQKSTGAGVRPPPDGDYVFWPLPEPPADLRRD